MKKISLLVFVLLMLCVAIQALAEMDGLYAYEINPDNTVTITGFDWKNNHGDIYIPEMLGNRIVSAIGEKAFMTTGNTAVKITLPDNIKSIGEQAFRGVAITYVNIPLNTVEIGGGAFAQCTVSRFNVANGHQVFATIDNALYNKQTKTLLAWPENKDIGEIPNGIKNIGDYVFYGRKFPTSYTFPDTVKKIGAHAFEEANIVLQTSSISEIDDYAFYKASVKINSTLSLNRIGKHAFEESIIWGTPHNQPLSATPYEVDEYAFYRANYDNKGNQNCYLELKNIISIGAHAFEGTGIKSHNTYNYYEYTGHLSISLRKGDLETLKYLGENAFSGSRVARWNDWNLDGYYAYVDLINSTLTSIPKFAFKYTVISDLKIGSSITEIEEGAFMGCEYLNKVELADGLHIIGDNAFYGCKELSAISIPSSVTMIGNSVFAGCSDKFVVTVEAGSYGEVWARTSGYSYVINGQEEDTSWLD